MFDNIMVNFKQVNKIQLNSLTAYLTGVIIGDGHIGDRFSSKNGCDYKISIELGERSFLDVLFVLLSKIIITKSKPKTIIRNDSRIKNYLQFRNKDFYYFLTKDLSIPSGKKSAIVVVPQVIMDNSLSIKKSFIAGLFDTDGGMRGDKLGFTSASENLIDGVYVILKELKVPCFKEKWFNKKYQKYYYGIKIRKSATNSFLNAVPIQNFEKLNRIKSSLCGRAGVVKRDGLSLGN